MVVVNITVKFFASFRETVNKDSMVMSLPEGATVDAMLNHLKAQYPVLRKYEAMIVAVNKQYQHGDFLLKDGDEVAIMPPISGG